MEEVYKTSGVSRPFYDYLVLGRKLILAGFIGENLIISLFSYALGLRGLKLFFTPIVLSIVITLITIFLIGFYPIYTKDLAENDINHNLLYSVSFMLMLSKGGIAIERIIEQVSETEPSQYIRRLLNKFIINITIFGFNPQESLRDISKRSPSETFSKFLDSIILTIQTSGNLDNLFQYEVDLLNNRKKEENQELLNKIGFLSEVYVTLLVITPLLLIILLTTFSFASGQGSGTAGFNTLNLVVFAGIPIISAILLILIDMQVRIS
jgi:flagellar protein FlaJ